MAEAFLGAGENRLVIARFDVDHTIGAKPRLGKCRREQIRPCQAPKHLPACARGDAGGEQSGRGAVDGAIAAAGDFMHRTARQAAAG